MHLQSEDHLIIYTDGSCLSNPGGIGGWAGLIICADEELLVSGGLDETTNNKAEMIAVIESLKFVHAGSPDLVSIVSDSRIVVNCANGSWRRKSNLDLWEELDREINRIGCPIRFYWVKGHAGNPRNEEVDEAANEEAKTLADAYGVPQ